MPWLNLSFSVLHLYLLSTCLTLIYCSIFKKDRKSEHDWKKFYASVAWDLIVSFDCFWSTLVLHWFLFVSIILVGKTIHRFILSTDKGLLPEVFVCSVLKLLFRFMGFNTSTVVFFELTLKHIKQLNLHIKSSINSIRNSVFV